MFFVIQRQQNWPFFNWINHFCGYEKTGSISFYRLNVLQGPQRPSNANDFYFDRINNNLREKNENQIESKNTLNIVEL